MKHSDYPALYQAADKTAIDTQKNYFNILRWQAILLVSGSLLALFGIESPLSAAIAAMVFIATLAITAFIAFKKYERVWYKARAAAESIKTMTWRFIMRAEPFDGGANTATAAQKFIDRLRETLRESESFGEFLSEQDSDLDQITKEMENARILTLDERKAIYKIHRIDEQRNWYRNKSSYNKLRSRTFFLTMAVLQFLAVIFSVFRIVFPMWHYWPTEVCVVASGSIFTWMQAKRFEEHAAAYTLTAHEIGIIASKITAVSSEGDFATFVADAENAFSREHTQWAAKRDY